MVDYTITDNVLRFNDSFNGKIDRIKFGDDLHTIEFGNCLNRKICNVKFPINLHTLIIRFRDKIINFTGIINIPFM